MPPTLLESNRTLFRGADSALASILAHGALIWCAVGLTAGTARLPENEREARVFFLLPPDRVDVRLRQSERIQWGRLGADLENGRNLTRPGEGRRLQAQAYGARPWGERSGARGQLPFGPVPDLVPDTAFSVLEVDEMVERYEDSAAPVYPPDLLALGAQGDVRARYVVDTTGRVDTTTIHILESDDPRFAESVRTALGGMRFRPARRGSMVVRQLVEQRFRFRIAPPEQAIAPRCADCGSL